METIRSSALIYMLVNKVNGKRYIGFTTNLPSRLSGHLARAKAGTHDFILSNAIRKHGWDAFDCTVLVEGWDIDYIKDELEPHFIKEYETYYELGKGYNMTYGGEGTLGYKRTPEQCANMSKRMKGRKPSEETRQRMSIANSGEGNPNYGNRHNEETRAKISAGIKQALTEGRGVPVWTPERRAKVSAAHKGKIVSEEARRNMSKAQLGKPGHPHTEEHKQYMSEIMKGRIVKKESSDKLVLSAARHLWTIQAPNGVVYESYSLLGFCKAFPVNPNTIVMKWDRKQRDIKVRKSSCLWEPLSRVDMTDEIRESFKGQLGVCWRIRP